MEISKILNKIENKEIVVPEFQREYIWNKQQAKDLLTSLYRSWPTGSLLFWRIYTKDEFEFKLHTGLQDYLASTK